MRYAPPQKIALSKQIKKNLIASAVLFAISFNCHAIIGDTIDKDYLLNDEDTGEGEYDQFRLTLTKNEDFLAFICQILIPLVNTTNMQSL